MAKEIAAALDGNSIVIKKASEFSATDLLPAEILFLGCEEPSPASFSYLEELLQHINLIGRPCGIFSPDSKKAIKYLSGIVASSEAVCYSSPLFAEDIKGIKKWTTGVIAAKN